MQRALLLVLLVPALAGCLDDDAPDDVVADPPLQVPANVQVFGDPMDLVEILGDLGATAGTYYTTGAPTFEPTIGTTSTGAIFMTSFRGTGDGTHIMRSQDQGQSWVDVGPFLGPTEIGQVPNSNDPYLYVDPWTDRVYKFDMCLTLSGFCVEYSDDEGDTWMLISVATGEQPALDHQSLVAVPAEAVGLTTVGYPNALVFCVNRGPNAAGSWCSTSLDGGIAWTPLVPGYPTGTLQCTGLHAHLSSGADGAIYRGQPSCDGPAVYRSLDGGMSWSEHTITSEVGIQQGSHEVATAVDAAGGVHAFWIGSDGLPYLASSADQGETWGDPRMVAPPGVTATGFPTIEAGDDGRVAFAYIGSTADGGYGAAAADMDWNGYIGVVVNAFDGSMAVATTSVNHVDDPLAEGLACGAIRCGGFGDFIDVAIDPEGRPWAALSHNGQGNTGIVGTLTGGPVLRGNGTLSALPPGPI